MSKPCPMCNKPIVFMSNRSKYCSVTCKHIAKKARDRVYRQNKKYAGFQRCCSRCTAVYDKEQHNDKYCPACSVIMRSEPTKHICDEPDCEKTISSKRKKCPKHQEQYNKDRRISINKKLREETQKVKKIAEEKGVTKSNTGIDPSRLVRGKIHYQGYGERL